MIYAMAPLAVTTNQLWMLQLQQFVMDAAASAVCLVKWPRSFEGS